MTAEGSMVVGLIKRGAYYDSVTLMAVARELASLEGVTDAAVVMGTPENRGILAASSMLAPEFEGASANDLLIAVSAAGADAAAAALAAADDLLAGARRRSDEGPARTPKTLGGAIEAFPDSNLALVSVAGRYAGDLAREALDRGLHVMLFSDNVPLETEVALKARARERGLLVMGPDCGTAIVNGVPLGFANAVQRGPIGIVAASGTGLQEVSSIISNRGAGISQAIGTGGRDVTAEVGGVTFLDALAALGEDDFTRVIVLVSKPPDEQVLARILESAERTGKPVVSVFLGERPRDAYGARTLAEAAAKAVAALEGGPPDCGGDLARDFERAARDLAGGIASSGAPGRRYLRALMSGGTFAAEAQVVLEDLGLGSVYSNVPTGRAGPLDDPLLSRANTIVDMGADNFTVGRPHPMIDYSLRVERVREEAEDPEVAVILLDVVLGFGSHPDPASELAPAIREASERVAVVCSVTGTERDPQGRRAVYMALAEAGAHVARTNAEASMVAGHVALARGEA
jgi:succinyl-CoA synthetase alpha subunit